jgi:hypothetical protein
MYRFKSKADGDLLMMAPVGDQILRIIGREPAPQGIIELARIPAAISALEQAIAQADAERRQARDAGLDDERDAAGGAVAVGLGQRAWPMLEMMRRSLAEHADIVWGV